MKRLLIPLAVIIISSLIFVSCSSTTLTTQTKPPTTSAATTQATAPASTTTKPVTSAPATNTVTPQSGGTVKVYLSGQPNSIGYPIAGLPNARTASFLCLDALFAQDSKGNLFPMLATGYKFDPAAKTITLTLRKGVKFHDGTDFNAAICKWNLDQYRTSAKPELKSVTSVDLIDDYTVKLNLSEFQNTLLYHLSGFPGMMISKAAFDANGQAWCEKNPVGAGPFKFESWEKDISMKFSRFNDYWGGKPYLDGVNLITYADANVALMDLKAGNLDQMSVDASAVKDLLASGKFYIIAQNFGQAPSIAGDATKPPFNDIRVRQAISYAMDTKTMSDSFGLGSYTSINQWAVPGTWAYNPNVAGYPYNPQKAKELLTAAGYPNGFKTTFHFNNYTPSASDWATAVQSSLRSVGIEVTLNKLGRSVYNDFAALGKGFDGILHLMGAAQPDPLLSYANIATSVDFTNMLKPQEFKDTYTKAVTVADQESKQKLVWDLQSLAIDKYCMQTFFWLETTQYATNTKLNNISRGPDTRLDCSKGWFSK